MSNLAYSHEMPEAPGVQDGQAQPAAAGTAAVPDASARPIPRINIQAFCEDQGTAAILQQASQDRRLAKAHVTVQMGGVEAGACVFNQPTCHHAPEVYGGLAASEAGDLLQDFFARRR